MPLDYRLAMAAPQERFGTLKDIMAIGQLHDQDRKQQQARIDAQKQAQADQIIQQTLQQFPDRPDEAVTALRKAGQPQAANDFELHLTKVRKAKLDERGAMIDQEYKLGQIDKQKADAEKAAIAAVDPMDALPFVAMAQNQEDYDNGLGLIRFKFGPKADAVIAQLPPQWSPEVATRLSNIMLGPKGAADIANQKADNTRQQEVAEQARHAAAMAAADRLEDNARMAAQAAEQARHNKAVEKAQAQQESRLATQAAAGGTGKTLSPTAESNIINRLSTQWMTASKGSRELDRAVALMDTGLTAARRGDMAQGAQAVLVTFQKILDPTSVVRESEYARSASGLALLDQIQGAYERLAKGGAGVPITELEKFGRLAKEMAEGQRASVNAVRSRLNKTAERYNIPTELVTDEQGGSPAPAAAATAVPKPVADILASQPDGRYTLTDGSVWVKQGGKITKGGG